MSSDQGSDPVVAAYAFEQLQTPAYSPDGTADLLSEAMAQADQIRDQARLTAEAEGRAAGLAAGRAELGAALAALAAAVRAVEDLGQALAAELEPQAAELAFALAEQILAGILTVEPERVVQVARNALRRAADRRRVTLVVNPDDLEIINASAGSLQAELGGIEHCEVQTDRRVGRGGVLLQTEAGEIDVTVASQLERAREIVAAALKRDADGS